MAFVRASKKRTKIRAAFGGPAGSGKTMTALQLATLIPGKIALVDTEGESASKYADLFEFDSLSLTKDYHPKHFISAIKDAEEGGYSTLVIDSLTHEWVGPGGILDLVDREKDKFSNGWKKASPLHDALVQAILTSKVNILATLRSKMAYESTKEDGRTVIRKLGLAPVTREGMEYEFDFFLDLGMDGTMSVAKSRAMGYVDTGDTFRRAGLPDVFAKLLAWAANGVEDPAPAIKAAAVLSFKAAIADATTMDALRGISDAAKAQGLGDDIRADLNARAADLKPQPPTPVTT